MELSIRRWKPGQLLMSWGLYWGGLVGATSIPAIRATWRATQLPDGHGSISAGFDNAIASYNVIENGVKTINASAPMSTIVAWVIGPPLLIWLVWLFSRDRSATQDRALGSEGRDALSAGAPPAEEWRSNQDERMRVERERVRTPNP